MLKPIKYSAHRNTMGRIHMENAAFRSRIKGNTHNTLGDLIHWTKRYGVAQFLWYPPQLRYRLEKLYESVLIAVALKTSRLGMARYVPRAVDEGWVPRHLMVIDKSLGPELGRFVKVLKLD